jgi:AmmeMemoRadiSam system protein B
MERIRQPAVAGSFYPAEPGILRRQVEDLLAGGSTEGALGAVAPHAGYVYSGGVAGLVYGTARIPETVVLLGPNHRGLGATVALPAAAAMATPLGEVPVHEALAEAFLEACPGARRDAAAHKREHCLEVQIPFLQVARGGRPLWILPVLLGTLDPATLARVGSALGAALAREAPDSLLVASTDMSHFLPDRAARVRDQLAIQEMERLDAEGLRSVCTREQVTMCGLGGATVVMQACRDRGASHGRLLRYATSADAGGDPAEVVGYAGLLIR